MQKILIVCTTDSMIWNFLVPHITELEERGYYIECAASRTGVFFDDLIDIHNIKMNEIPFERSPYKVSNIIAYKKLCALIKEKGFDTIFCHEPVGGAMGRLAGHYCGCKVIYMAHGFHFYKGAPKTRVLYYIIEKFLSRFTDVLLTINQEDYESSLKFYAKKNYKLNGIGVDTSKFVRNDTYKDYIKQELQLPENSITLLSVGELIERKNHEAIIRAVAKIDNQKIYYLIAGDGELKQHLLSIIQEFKLVNQVILLGYRNDIRELCNATDVFVMPSVHEGLSVALMEAMGCGKPIVASRIRGNVDLVDDNKGGILVDAFDVSGYAEAIKKIVNDQECMKRMGDYNIHKVRDYDVKNIKKILVELIER